MIITINQAFWLAVISLIAFVILQLRQQKILRSLAENLVAIQIRHEDSTTKLVSLCTHIVGFEDLLFQILKDNNKIQESLVKSGNHNVCEFLTRLRELEDRLQQNKVVIENHVDALISKETNILREQMETIIEDKLKAVPITSPRGSIAEQIQNLNMEQFLELASKSGPILDIIGKFRNGTSGKKLKI